MSSAQMFPFPTLLHRKLIDLLALQFGELFDRFAQRNHCCHGDMGWHTQELLYFRLFSHCKSRQRPA